MLQKRKENPELSLVGFFSEIFSTTLLDFQKDQDNIKVENTAVMAKATVKVCTRNWYENNKHVYPANVWESYEPEKKYEKYKKSGKVEEGSKAGLEINTKASR